MQFGENIQKSLLAISPNYYKNYKMVISLFLFIFFFSYKSNSTTPLFSFIYPIFFSQLSLTIFFSPAFKIPMPMLSQAKIDSEIAVPSSRVLEFQQI
jgi:hypothetical protein